MLREMISYHLYIVEGLAIVVLLSMLLPWIIKHDHNKLVLWTRIGYFAFWMFWAMAVFSGLILFMFTGREMTTSIWLMIIVSLQLPLLDGFRALRLKRLWVEKREASRISMAILSIELLLIATVMVAAIRG